MVQLKIKKAEKYNRSCSEENFVRESLSTSTTTWRVVRIILWFQQDDAISHFANSNQLLKEKFNRRVISETVISLIYKDNAI